MPADLEEIEHDWLAFRNDPKQGDKIRACDYHDTWIGTHADAKKKWTDWFVCANESTNCLTVAVSVNWARQFPGRDPFAYGTRWYCPNKDCTTRYKTK